MMKSGSPAACNVAFAAIRAGFSALARELALQMITQPENNLRRQAVELLNLEQRAQIAELKPNVDEVLIFHLQSNSPAAQVQAMILLVDLEERERCPQLVDLDALHTFERRE